MFDDDDDIDDYEEVLIDEDLWLTPADEEAEYWSEYPVDDD